MKKRKCTWNGVEYNTILEAFHSQPRDYSYRTFYRLVNKGITCDSDIPTPNQSGRPKIPFEGFNSLTEYAEHEGISVRKASYRHKKAKENKE